MDGKIERQLDRIGIHIVNILQRNARTSFSELGRKVGLSTPAAAERVRKLEESGVISGYHASVDPARIGLPVTAFIQLTTPSENYPRLKSLVEGLEPVVECHHISGEASFLIKAVAASVTDLEALVDQLGPFGRTRTTVVLSSQIVRRSLPLR